MRSKNILALAATVLLLMSLALTAVAASPDLRRAIRTFIGETVGGSGGYGRVTELEPWHDEEAAPEEVALEDGEAEDETEGKDDTVLEAAHGEALDALMGSAEPDLVAAPPTVATPPPARTVRKRRGRKTRTARVVTPEPAPQPAKAEPAPESKPEPVKEVVRKDPPKTVAPPPPPPPPAAPAATPAASRIAKKAPKQTVKKPAPKKAGPDDERPDEIPLGF